MVENSIQYQLQIVQALIAIIGVGTGAATIYLRLFVRGELMIAKNEIVDKVKAEFVSKEVLTARIDMLEYRLKMVEVASNVATSAATAAALISNAAKKESGVT